MQTVTPFLMFAGQAEAAMTLYTTTVKNSAITSVTRYGPNEAGAEGTVQLAHFTLDGQEFMAIDSNVEHGFTFTPSISLYVRCATEAEIDAVYTRLVEGGQVLMELAAYPFSPRFAWIQDRFGVSWQLSLA